jgi:hypothetical protein
MNPSEMVSSLLDGEMSPREQRKALAHVESCRSCHAQYQVARSLRQNMLQMDGTPVPEQLSGRLQVLSSHERDRRLRRASLSTYLRYHLAQARLCFDNLMRPHALPFAGGVISALLMVVVWFPYMAAQRTVDDVPVFPNPTGSELLRMNSWGYIAPSPLDVRATGAGDAVLELTIDEHGRVVDYDLTSGEMTPELGSMILLSRFAPATHFGRPTSGKLVYRLSQISVHPIG